MIHRKLDRTLTRSAGKSSLACGLLFLFEFRSEVGSPTKGAALYLQLFYSLLYLQNSTTNISSTILDFEIRLHAAMEKHITQPCVAPMVRVNMCVYAGNITGSNSL